MKSNFLKSFFSSSNHDQSLSEKGHEIIVQPGAIFTSEGGEFLGDGIRIHEQSYRENEETDEKFMCP
tara:strand:+ start:32617 stop:32817 length:201 start_codon:yes stop_codon:yes gene_type:complete